MECCSNSNMTFSDLEPKVKAGFWPSFTWMHQWILFWKSHHWFFDEVPKIIFMDFGSLMSQIRNHIVSLSNSLQSENPAVLEHILVVYFWLLSWDPLVIVKTVKSLRPGTSPFCENRVKKPTNEPFSTNCNLSIPSISHCLPISILNHHFWWLNWVKWQFPSSWFSAIFRDFLDPLWGKKNQLATAQLLLGAMAALDPVDCRGQFGTWALTFYSTIFNTFK